MCARRFLTLIFIVILIAVAGAFALFQFGDEVLLKQATPQGHYQEPPKASGPDYSSDASWLAKPGLADDPSAWDPEGIVTTKAAQPAATFLGFGPVIIGQGLGVDAIGGNQRGFPGLDLFFNGAHQRRKPAVKVNHQNGTLAERRNRFFQGFEF